MASHKISITFDEATNALHVVHRCSVDVAGHTVSHAEDIELTETGGVLGMLKGLIDSNRTEMEAIANLHGVNHASAFSGKALAGVKKLTIGGAVGVASATAVKKT